MSFVFGLDMFIPKRWDVVCPLCGVVSEHDVESDAIVVQDVHDNTIGHDCVIVPIPKYAAANQARAEVVLFDGEPIVGGGV